MSVNATVRSELTVVETIEDTYLSTNDKTVTHNGLNTNQTLTGASAVPATKVVSFQLAMVDGAAEIDLRALPGTNGGTIDGNGLKVQAFKFRGKSTNANPITIATGASNGYDLLGAHTIDLKANQHVLGYLADGAEDIDSTHKILDVTGTGTQVLEVELVLG